MIVSTRLSFTSTKNDWFNSLKLYKQINNIELAFYLPEDFYHIKPEDVYQPIIENSVVVNSIHLPHINFLKPDIVLNVLEKILLIAKNLKCNMLVAHPNFGKYNKFEETTKDLLSDFLNKYNLDFCWETFSSRRRIFSDLEKLKEFCQKNQHFYICYDTSHVGKTQNKTISDLEKYSSFIKVIHISNISSKLQHLPLWEKDGILDFNEILRMLKKNGTAKLF